jgi:hypothetical protein
VFLGDATHCSVNQVTGNPVPLRDRRAQNHALGCGNPAARRLRTLTT